MRRKRLYLVALLVLLTSNCLADVMTFDGLTGGPFGTVTTQGFVFNAAIPITMGYLFPISTTDTCSPACVFNGTTSLGVANEPVTMVTQSGNPFALPSFDIANFLNFAADPVYGADFVGSLRAVTLTGTAVGGQTLITTFQITNPYQFTTFTLPADWNNLVSVTFGGISLDPRFLPSMNLDNIHASQVPEPSSILLLSAGLAGLCGVRRRKVRT